MKDNTMNVIKRTCATCAAFNPAPEEDDPACLNLTFITENHGTPQAVSRDPEPADWCPSHQTHEEDAVETYQIEVARHVAESAPEFLAAMDACLALVESLGMDHTDTTRAMQRAMQLSPPSLNALMADKARELDLIPDAHGYTDDGQPVFSLESVAAKLGLSMEEAKQAMDDMLAAREEMGLPAALVDPAKVHRKH